MRWRTTRRPSRCIQRALAANERILGANHPETLRSVHNLAELYRSKGDDASAEPLLKRALAGNEKTLGADHPETLRSVHGLGAAIPVQGR